MCYGCFNYRTERARMSTRHWVEWTHPGNRRIAVVHSVLLLEVCWLGVCWWFDSCCCKTVMPPVWVVSSLKECSGCCGALGGFQMTLAPRRQEWLAFPETRSPSSGRHELKTPAGGHAFVAMATFIGVICFSGERLMEGTRGAVKNRFSFVSPSYLHLRPWQTAALSPQRLYSPWTFCEGRTKEVKVWY